MSIRTSRPGGRTAPELWRASRPKGTAESIYSDLKTRILQLHVPPGTALSEPELALGYGVSRTPVREALIRLADEGLVAIVPKSGTTVARIPLDLLPEAILVRQALEEVTTRKAAEAATPSAALELEAALLRQEEVADTGDLEAFHRADEHFHATIATIAGHPGIWTLVERAKMHIDRYRRLTLPQDGRRRLVIEQHRAVLDAIRARDPEAAAAAMRRHLQGLEVGLDTVRTSHPDYFE